jgi:hypothetical protein
VWDRSPSVAICESKVAVGWEAILAKMPGRSGLLASRGAVECFWMVACACVPRGFSSIWESPANDKAGPVPASACGAWVQYIIRDGSSGLDDQRIREARYSEVASGGSSSSSGSSSSLARVGG